MCLAMNPDKLIGNQLCASSSNRNFKGRQGSPTGRTFTDESYRVCCCSNHWGISDAGIRILISIYYSLKSILL